ncbi:MAG: c-type cytochrome [Saprospiraceae bacterium]|nr:c-type cytochrome [Saprospiraceae bacterium]
MKNTPPFFLLITPFTLLLSCSNPTTTPNPHLTANDTIFTPAQADLGATLYTTSCASCHGYDLKGTEGGNALVGDRFINKWAELSLDTLFEVTRTTMPKTNPHSLDDEAYVCLLAFILRANAFPAGSTSLSSDKNDLKQLKLGKPPVTARTAMQFVPGVVAVKSRTIEAEWKQHRGDYASTNYAPLDQINKDNVKI